MQSMEQIKPLRDMVLLEVVNQERTRSGVILPGKVDAEGPSRCKVLEVGEAVTLVKPGDLVIVDPKLCYGLRKNLGIGPEGAIYGIVTNPEEQLEVEEPDSPVLQ